MEIGLTEIEKYNPWWLNKRAIEEDKHIKDFEKSIVKWAPDLESELKLDIDAIYSVRGPRQVGKTTFVKTQIRALLQKVEPRRLMFYSCDLITKEELKDILVAYIEWIREITASRVYIFLDEISSVKDWQKSLKVLYDRGELEKVTVLLTGSHSIDIKKSAELLPGRRGSVSKPDKEYLPMSFREYVYTLNSDIAGKEPMDLEPFIGVLNKLLDKFLLTGGFPRVLNSYLPDSKIEDYIYDDYLSGIIGDFRKMGKSEYYLKEVLRAILETLTSSVGWETLKKRTEIGSVNTIHEYVEDLKDSFLVDYLFNIDLSTLRPSLLKNKKVYIRDPFIYHAVRKLVHNTTFGDAVRVVSSPEEKSKLVESIVCDHLIRAFNEVYHWRGKKGREVDFVVKEREKLVGIEVKFRNKPRKPGASLLKFKKALILTKHDFDLKARHPEIPVCIFLLDPKKFVSAL